MADNLQTTFSQAFFKGIMCFDPHFNEVFMVHEGSFDNTSAVILILALFTDAYILDFIIYILH